MDRQNPKIVQCKSLNKKNRAKKKETVDFESLVTSGDFISEEKILDWLLNADDITFSNNCDHKINSTPMYSQVIDDYELEEKILFFLDPDTAGVLVAGLGLILNWYSSEKRHREDQKSPPSPPNKENDDFGDIDRCKKMDGKRECSLPIINEMEVRGAWYVIRFRYCSKTPTHITVEFHKLQIGL